MVSGRPAAGPQPFSNPELWFLVPKRVITEGATGGVSSGLAPRPEVHGLTVTATLTRGHDAVTGDDDD